MLPLPLWSFFGIASGVFLILAGGALFLQWLVELARNSAYDTGTLAYVSMSTLLERMAAADPASPKGRGKSAPSLSATKTPCGLAGEAKELFADMKEGECHLSQLRRMSDGLSTAKRWLGTASVVLCALAGLVALIPSS